MSASFENSIEAFFSDPKITKYLFQRNRVMMTPQEEYSAETIELGRCKITVSRSKTKEEICLKFEYRESFGYSTLGSIYYNLIKDICTNDYRTYYSISYFLNSFEKEPFCTRTEAIERLFSFREFKEWMLWNVL